MTQFRSDLHWLGPFASPITITLTLLGLAVSFVFYADTIGWGIVSLVFFGVSSAWCAWFLMAQVTIESTLEGVAPHHVARHQSKLLRRIAPIFPIVAGVLCGIAFLQPEEKDYSDLLQGGGPYSPIVVFDSNPQGADVKLSWSLYAESDPWLENADDERVFHIGKTLTRARLGQGHYWAVLELDGKRIQKGFMVNGPTVVTVEF